MSSFRRPWCCAKPPAARRAGGRRGRAGRRTQERRSKRGAGRQTGERHTADAAISPTVSVTCACPDIHNPTDLAPRPSTTPSIRTPRMPRYTQHDRTADDTSRPHTVRINPRVATYTTQQIDQPKPIRPATGSSRVCPDIRNPTNPAPRPSTTPSIRTPRMSRHTQPDKSARQEITETGSKPITYATTHTT